MATLTDHAQERLYSRYGVSNEESMSIVGARLGDRDQYIIKGHTKDGAEVRRISYNGEFLFGLVRDNRVITVLWDKRDYDNGRECELPFDGDFRLFRFINNDIRALVDKDGNPWFVASDICGVLKYSNHSKAICDHVDKEDKLNNKSLSSLGQRGGWIVNESGMYSLILRSNLPDARKFKRWVTSEVLPNLRRQKETNSLPDFANPAEAARAWANEYEKRIEAEKLNAINAPKAEFYDRVTNEDNCIDMAEAAHVLNIPGIGRNKLFAMLRGLGLLRKNNEPYQQYVNAGYFRVVENDTPIGVKLKTLVTQRGLDYIRRAID